VVLNLCHHQELKALKCRNCGDPVDPRRVELGYDYCLKDECQKRCIEPVRLASIGVNKAADYIMRADELLPPRRPNLAGQEATGHEDDEDDQDDDTMIVVPARPPTAPTRKRRPTTLERLRRLEAELDAAVDRSYQRFAEGELTAKELDRERDSLIRAFNQQVMAENIRYRSLLRRPASPGPRR
jgi:hypothetical protein